MRKVAIFGATGSVGTQVLDVISYCNSKLDLPDFNVIVVAAFNEKEEIEKISKKFDCETVLFSEEGRQGLINMVSREDVDTIVMALTGVESIYPTIMALKLGKRVLLATKEALVVAGERIMEVGGELLSIDSEHNAIFQALNGENRNNVRRVYLTCSGGPFLGLTRKELESKTVEDAMTHPVWGMGTMNTVNSATLFNKALEVIEAHYIFNLPYEKIKVVIHPEAYNHGTVEFVDGFSISVISDHTMKKPIAHALGYPERIAFSKDNLPLGEPMTYMGPDYETFILLELGINAGKIGGTAPLALHAINSVVVEEAVKDLKKPFLWIQDTVAEIFSHYVPKQGYELDELMAEHEKVEEFAKNYIKKKG